MEDGRPRLTPERMNSFSDGVLAIVVTILVLDIRVPEQAPSIDTLPKFLADVHHDIIIYAVSFWLVGLYWLLHHYISSYVRYVDRRLMVANLLFLFFATLLPFATKLKNTYPHAFATSHLLGMAHAACGLSLLVLWRSVYARPASVGSAVPASAAKRLIVGVGTGCSTALVGSFANYIQPGLSTYLFPIVPLTYGYGLWHITDS